MITNLLSNMNSMWCFYFIALVPILMGLVFFFLSKRINIAEWIIGSVTALIVAGIMNICAYTGMTSDQEIWSGSVTQTVKHPFYVESYQVAIYRTDMELRSYYDGKHMSLHMVPVQHFDHWETRYRNHDQYFTKEVSFGVEGRSFNINEAEYNDVVNKFGGTIVTNTSMPSGFFSGDPNTYFCPNKTGYIIPAAITKSWSNKVKASPSSFSFSAVPTNAPVYEYPSCLDTWHSDRLLGDAGTKISSLAFDQLNAKLGPRKLVNIIVVGFASADAKLGKSQEAKWIGGKKNDVVICYGYAPLEGNVPAVCWAYCFSWCKNDQTKRNIEKLFLNEALDDTILPKLEKEIVEGYQKRQWSDFDKLTVKPRPVHYKIFISIMILTQIILYAGFIWLSDRNDSERKENPFRTDF